MTESRTNDFLATFNAIENYFRSKLHDDNSGFRKLLDIYANKYNLRRAEVDALNTYAALRNFLVHNEYHDGKQIAEPIPAIVEAIQSSYERITRPPTVLSTLPHRKICSFAATDPISAALEAVRMHGYSQFPVYSNKAFIGLLTTNCISRWLADRLHIDGLVESEPISAVLQFAEKQDHVRCLPRATTSGEAIKALSPPISGGAPPAALLITETGDLAQRPLAIVVADDLGILLRSLN